MSWVKVAGELFQWIILAGKILIAAILIMLIYVIYNFVFGFKSAEFTRVALTSSAESDLVVTSFAQVDLLHLRNRSDEIMIPNDGLGDNYEAVVDDKFENARAYCLHSYEVVFGYPSLAVERQNVADRAGDGEPVPKPGIVAVNTLRTENAPDTSTLWCQRKNLKSKRADLEDYLLNALNHDDVLVDHINHGQMLLASTLDLADPACRKEEERVECLAPKLKTYWDKRANETQTSLDELDVKLREHKAKLDQLSEQMPDIRDALQDSIADFEADALRMRRSIQRDSFAARSGADIASLVLTFSSTLGVSEERKRFLGLWKSKRFYLQRDIAKVYYGARVAPSSVQSEWRLFAPDRVEIVLPKPSIIAMDRYSSFVVARNKIEGKGTSNQSLANYLNQQILHNLEKGISRFHQRAVSTAQTIMLARVPAYFGLEDFEYTVKFDGDGSLGPSLEFIAGVLDLEASETVPVQP